MASSASNGHVGDDLVGNGLVGKRRRPQRRRRTSLGDPGCAIIKQPGMAKRAPIDASSTLVTSGAIYEQYIILPSGGGASPMSIVAIAPMSKKPSAVSSASA